MTDAPLLGEPPAVELMNTIWADRHGGYDALADTAGVLGWLAAVGDRVDALDPSELTALTPAAAEAVAADLRRLRDALRDLAAEVTGDVREVARPRPQGPDPALATVNRLAGSAPRWPTLAVDPDGGWRRVVVAPGGAAAAAVAELAADAVELFAGADRARLRACGGPGCTLYFVKAHARREWCSAACGNRARVARHYRRHQTSSSPAASSR